MSQQQERQEPGHPVDPGFDPTISFRGRTELWGEWTP